MVNTQILHQQFEYLEPQTMEEALHLLKVHGSEAKVLAGGTDLLVQMKMDRLYPRCLVQISPISALRVLRGEGGLRLGALLSFREIEKFSAVKEKYTALFEAAQSVSSVQIRHMGTVGGNLCHASPAADSAPPLIAFGAKVRIAAENAERLLLLEEFFRGPGETVLTPQELLCEILVPELAERTGSAFLKMTRVAADLAKVSVAAVIEREGDICRKCRVVLGAVAKTPFRSKRAEAVLQGRRFGENLAEEAGRQAAEEIHPITDTRSTAWYRREVSIVLVRQALNLAWKRGKNS